MEKISAIILNYNSSQDCKKCISFLEKQDYENYEIIVVDNNSSSENEVRIVKELCSKKDIKLILNNDNLGFAAGNNIGLRHAVKNGADWCVIINPDVELRDTNYFSHMMKVIRQYKNVAVAASSVVLPNGELQNPQKESTFFYDVFWFAQYFKKNDNNLNWNVEKQETKYCEKVSGCCFFIKTDFLKEIGYLDENTFLYCEEAILAKQVHMSGRKILYVHDIRAFHMHTENETNMYYKMKVFLKSRKYFIKEYSNYNFLKKMLVLLSIQSRKMFLVINKNDFLNKEENRNGNQI